MTIFSPGTSRATAPAIPEEAQAKLKLMGLVAEWDAVNRVFNLYLPSNPAQVWYHVSWHDSWDPSLEKVANDLAAKYHASKAAGAARGRR